MPRWLFAFPVSGSPGSRTDSRPGRLPPPPAAQGALLGCGSVTCCVPQGLHVPPYLIFTTPLSE